MPLDRSGIRTRRSQHVDGAAFDREHQNRSAKQHDGKCRDERCERQRLRQQGAGHGGEDVAQAAVQQRREVAAKQDGDEHGRADDRNGQEHLECGFGEELDHDRRPVGGDEQGAPLQEVLQIQSIQL